MSTYIWASTNYVHISRWALSGQSLKTNLSMDSYGIRQCGLGRPNKGKFLGFSILEKKLKKFISLFTKLGESASPLAIATTTKLSVLLLSSVCFPLLLMSSVCSPLLLLSSGRSPLLLPSSICSQLLLCDSVYSHLLLRSVSILWVCSYWWFCLRYELGFFFFI